MSEFSHALGADPTTGAIPQKTLDWLAGNLSGSGASGTVTSVNGVAPDASGNIILTGLDAGIQVGGTAPAEGWWIDTGSDDGSVPATIPGKVTGLSATNANGVITLAWTTPANGGSPITDYTVQHKPTTDATWATYADGVNTLTSTLLTGLPDGVARDFRVAAVNALGTGAWSDVAQATPETDLNLYVSDDFNRPDAETLGVAITGQTWTWPTGAAGGGRLRSQAVETTSDRGVNLIQSSQTDVFVQVTFVPEMGIAFRKPGVIARVNAAATDYYSLEVFSATEMRVYRCVAGTRTNIMSITPSPAPSDTDRIGLKVFEAGGSTTLQAYRGATLLDSVTDSTANRPLTGTFVGFTALGNYGRFDDFTATDPSA